MPPETREGREHDDDAPQGPQERQADAEGEVSGHGEGQAKRFSDLVLDKSQIHGRMLSMKAKREKPSHVVRRAVADSGLSNYRICRAAGLNVTMLSRFMDGTQNLTLTTLDALAPVLRLRIVADGPVKVLPMGRPGRKPKAKKGR